MRLLLGAGLALVALGTFVLVAHPSMGSQRRAMQVGDMEVSVEGQDTVPPWVGWAAIIGGVLLVGGGIGRRRTR